jgi:hypothetical protein
MLHDNYYCIVIFYWRFQNPVDEDLNYCNGLPAEKLR